MILFTLLAIALLVVLVLAVTVLGVFGGIAAFIFADVIICIALVVMLFRHSRKKRNDL